MKGDGHSAFFQDCEVSKWDSEECTKVCASNAGTKGGEQKLTRSVLTHPNGGAKCLPLAAERSCNNRPCPVNCQLKTWSGWSKCSAECGGGVTQRLREVKHAMRYNGKPCGATSQTTACNAQACEKDCKLSSWTKWGGCSKDCDGGTKKRQKFVLKQAEGAGKCAGMWSPERLQYQQCSMKRCKISDPNKPLACNRSLDVVLLIDGSGSLGQKGWNAEIKAAQYFVDAFSEAHKAYMSVLLYSGPRTWSGVYECTGKNAKTVDPGYCGIRMISHFTGDLKKVKQLITGLKWPQGSTLTSVALMTAKAELALGRKDSKANVVVFTDGKPLSVRKTELAALELRKQARLLWVPVTQHAPMKEIKKYATREWQENVVQVPSFAELEKPDVITHIIADICPDEFPEIRLGRGGLM